MNACVVRSFPKKRTVGLMSAEELWEHLEGCGETVPYDVAELSKLTEEHQKTLLAFSHYMTPHIRERLLMRLASCPCFYAPLFYELADRASRDKCVEAAALAVKSRCADAAYMLKNISREG